MRFLLQSVGLNADLTATERRILDYLIQDNVTPKKTKHIFTHCIEDNLANQRTISMHICNINKKLTDHEIVCVFWKRAIGYRLMRCLNNT